MITSFISSPQMQCVLMVRKLLRDTVVYTF